MVRFRAHVSLAIPGVVFGSGNSRFLVDKNINESESLNDTGIQKPEFLTEKHKLLTQNHDSDSDSEISKSESPESDNPQSAPPHRPRPFPLAARYFARLETTGKSKLCADCTFGGVHYYNSDEEKRYGMVQWVYGPREVPKERQYPARLASKNVDSDAKEYSKHVDSDSAHYDTRNDTREDGVSTVLAENLKLNVDAASDADAAADAFRARVRGFRERDGNPDEQVLPRHDFTDVFLGNRKEMFLITNPHDEVPGPGVDRKSSTNTHINANTDIRTQIDTNANSGSAKQENSNSASAKQESNNSASVKQENNNSAAPTALDAPAFPHSRTAVAPFQCLRVTDYYDNVFDYNWDAKAKYIGVEWFHHKLCKRWDGVMPFFIQGEQLPSSYYEGVFDGMPCGYSNEVEEMWYSHWQVYQPEQIHDSFLNVLTLECQDVNWGEVGGRGKGGEVGGRGKGAELEGRGAELEGRGISTTIRNARGTAIRNARGGAISVGNNAEAQNSFGSNAAARSGRAERVMDGEAPEELNDASTGSADTDLEFVFV